MSNWFVSAKRALRDRSLCAMGTRVAARSRLYQRKSAFEVLEPRLTLAAAGLVTTPQTYSGGLNGRVVFTSGGHGYGWNGSAFSTERPDYWQNADDSADGEIVEDFGNQDQMS